ncbi:MAG: ferritin family protein [Methanospirillum sp.]|uniref:ferritin-like domain-containing protein n=1 Tax=Methanospirillum sp. TaxID=45200 RepID=UPI00236F4AAD|nr:ferritin family protein [Methanospirillum sp.]MDD1730492.1 ferritin family protein [Methanospirillum sp.]
MKTEEFKKILLNAIDREVDSYALYTALADKVKDSALKSTFKELAQEETYHRKTLQEYLSGTKKELKFDEVKDYKLSNLIESPSPSSDMKPLEGLKLAIKKEEEAMQMYEKLADASADSEQKKIFTELAKMERGHKARLEDLYTNSAFVEAW